MYSARCFIYGILCQIISEKTRCKKDFACNSGSYKLEFAFLFSFRYNGKQESNIQEVEDLVTKKLFVYIEFRPNSIDF